MFIISRAYLNFIYYNIWQATAGGSTSNQLAGRGGTTFIILKKIIIGNTFLLISYL